MFKLVWVCVKNPQHMFQLNIFHEKVRILFVRKFTTFNVNTSGVSDFSLYTTLKRNKSTEHE